MKANCKLKQRQKERNRFFWLCKKTVDGMVDRWISQYAERKIEVRRAMSLPLDRHCTTLGNEAERP